MHNRNSSLHINNVPLLYALLYNKLIEKYGRMRRDIEAKSILETLHKIIYHVPTRYDYIIINEMVKLKLLIKISKNIYQIDMADYDSKVERLNSFFLWD